MKKPRGVVMMQSNDLLDIELLISTSSFPEKGGWIVDNEFILTLGTSYLLAHGLGKPVENAKKTISVRKSGLYHVYAYTYNWCAPWHSDMFPGLFRIKVGDALSSELGKGETWGWEDGGEMYFKDGENTIELVDSTGFEGRCAFLYISRDSRKLPSGREGILNLYGELVLKRKSTKSCEYDLIVVGGGIAGMCASLTAARSGLKTALVQDRPVVGGNNSSEIRVWLGGGTNYAPFAGIGNVVGEFEQEKIGHYGAVNRASLYEDDRKLGILESEENLTLYLSSSMVDADAENGLIKGITILDVERDELMKLSAPLFVDATGDGNLGALAGADYEVTTNGHMGASNLWHIEKTGRNAGFPHCPWAMNLSKAVFPGRGETKDIYGNSREFSLGCWFWESGMTEDPIEDAERIRDTNFRAMYGAWDALRNVDGDYDGYELTWCSPIAGKRESRRLLGDIVMTKADFRYSFPDACVATTWNFDVHYPDKAFYSAFAEGDAFLSMDCREKVEWPYFLPYRILYSRNIENMFMVGRCVSTSHDASGTVRVMRTGGLMGEIVGYASALCRKYGCLPRKIYTEHLDEFLALIKSIPCKEVKKAGSTVV
jgi:hypothetical protein